MKILLSILFVAFIFKASGQQATVTLDNYFNREWKKDSAGKKVLFHYTWDDKGNSGFSRLGDIFSSHGLRQDVLAAAPRDENLRNSKIYIIVDPDTDKETPNPNYIQARDIKAIKSWVARGGVLVLMGNDSGNAEFHHFNQLA
ncbi:MAG TPA: DUF4350 domain-containing protein, partial [Chitinophagaceae bacterium]|nr:DUF4350 domain-containing protein [Chitinophagaceae bacterium]